MLVLIAEEVVVEKWSSVAGSYVFGFSVLVLDHVERSSDPFKTSSKVDYYCCFS